MKFGSLCSFSVLSIVWPVTFSVVIDSVVIDSVVFLLLGVIFDCNYSVIFLECHCNFMSVLLCNSSVIFTH